MTILEEIQAERLRQDEKWGEQNHPIMSHEGTSSLFYEEEVHFWRTMNDKYNEAGHTNWEAILLEEVYESLEQASKGNIKELREELVQTAAVVVAMIECLDRNGL